MRNKIKIFGALLIIILSAVGCKKSFLELQPYSQLGFDKAITDEQSMLAALYGTYAGLRGVDAFGRSIPVDGDLYADNIYVSTQNSGRYIPQFNYQVTENDGTVDGMWAILYNAILRCNLIIAKEGDITGTKVPQYAGEAYAIRALCYFYLVQHFARPYTENPDDMGVPIVLGFDIAQRPERKSIGEVYTQILDDLTTAAAKVTTTANSSQFSPTAIKALRAKVLFYKGDYAGAKTTAADVISTGGYTLIDAAGFASYWSTPNFRTDKKETLFEVSFDPLTRLGTNSLSYIYVQDGYGDMLCTDELYNLYAATDVRKALIIPGIRGGAPALFVNKFPNGKAGLQNDDNTKILRLSEIYLIAAESEARAGTEVQALIYLNTLMSKRDPSFVGYASTGNQLLEDIIAERRKELAFEGNRWQDLNRLKRDITRSNQYPSAAQSLPFSDTKRIFPIPRWEMDSNPNMVQNPGY